MENQRTALAGSDALPCYASSCGRVTLYLGDSVALRHLVPADAAIISDPPYGIAHKRGKCSDRGKGISRGAAGIIGDEKPFDPAPWVSYPISLLWGANWYSDKLPPGRWLIWDKQEHGGSGDFSEAEVAWQNRQGSIKVFRHMWLGVQRASQVGEERRHPTEKPVVLMAWCMDKAKVPAGAVVVDPYMGSASTIIAAIRTGRKAIGFEKDPEHFANAVQRVKNELAQGDLFLGHNTQALPHGGAERTPNENRD